MASLDSAIELERTEGDRDKRDRGDEIGGYTERSFKHEPKSRRGAPNFRGGGLFTGVDKPVENYMDVINKEVLAPARSEGEPDADEGKAHNHVPGPDIGDWVASLGYVEDDDPEESDEKRRNHCGREPTRALELKRIFLRHDRRGTVIFLLLTES